ncbi:hypothetical protein CORC01_09046 [Colletotrichum orchidophilum]|uniref:Uncharacterized protein n=1 Tax=Colletotrichum orchidophilum TaxID=1209926 RepID=A0A1G4B2J8_9PEZI|nr:uncharacterized protein CORC01_09046 [Colletotrichum orchidophilum]OHE95614.1 hypothetical protein CORC01_09046 [Colletotrichum orchidophilum]
MDSWRMQGVRHVTSNLPASLVGAIPPKAQTDTDANDANDGNVEEVHRPFHVEMVLPPPSIRATTRPLRVNCAARVDLLPNQLPPGSEVRATGPAFPNVPNFRDVQGGFP